MQARRRSIRALAQVGLLSRGAVYLLIGIFTLLLVHNGTGSRATDSRGAMQELLQQPLGYVFLTIIGAGLFCYAIWRILQGYYDYDEYGTRAWSMFIRVAQALGGALHIGLSLYAFNLVFLFSRTAIKPSEQKLARWLFSLPFGDWLVALVGLAILIFAIAQIYMAWRETFRFYIVLPQRRQHWFLWICKYGLFARAIVFGMIGWFFVHAAWKHSPKEAGGFKEAWRALRGQPLGDLWVTVVAVGFLAYAFFSAVEARYRK